jgi:hypothetical protein
VRIQSNASFHSGIANGTQGAMHMGARLQMNGQNMGAEVCKRRDVPVGIDNHQMHIQRLGGVLGDG